MGSRPICWKTKCVELFPLKCMAENNGQSVTVGELAHGSHAHIYINHIIFIYINMHAILMMHKVLINITVLTSHKFKFLKTIT